MTATQTRAAPFGASNDRSAPRSSHQNHEWSPPQTTSSRTGTQENASHSGSNRPYQFAPHPRDSASTSPTDRCRRCSTDRTSADQASAQTPRSRRASQTNLGDRRPQLRFRRNRSNRGAASSVWSSDSACTDRPGTRRGRPEAAPVRSADLPGLFWEKTEAGLQDRSP